MNFPLTPGDAETSFSCRSYAVAGLLACLLFVAQPSLAAPPTRIAQRLKNQAKVQWASAPLRKTLVRLGTVFDVPMFIDRRVDPEWTVTLSLEKTPLEEVLRKATSPHALGFVVVGPVVYIGPASVAEKLPQLLESPPAATRVSQTYPSPAVPKSKTDQLDTTHRNLAR